MVDRCRCRYFKRLNITNEIQCPRKFRHVDNRLNLADHYRRSLFHVLLSFDRPTDRPGKELVINASTGFSSVFIYYYRYFYNYSSYPRFTYYLTCKLCKKTVEILSFKQTAQRNIRHRRISGSDDLFIFPEWR